MTDQDPRYGSAEPTTAYQKHDDATSRYRTSRSGWALAIAGIFILVAIAAVFFWPASTSAPSAQGGADMGATAPAPAR